MALKLSYVGLTLVMLIIIYFIGNYAIIQSTPDQKSRNRKKAILVIGLLLWQLYVYLIGTSGFLADFSLPPRFAILLILPLFAFTGIFLRINRNKFWIKTIPTIWITAYQSFRILIETIFVYTVAAGILHKNVTIEGYNYDMVFGYTAPIIAIIIYKSRELPKRLLLVWNYLGLAVISVIIFLFISTIYFPEMYGPGVGFSTTDFTMYPYVLVPGFLMPSAVFMHVLSIIQLRKK